VTALHHYPRRFRWVSDWRTSFLFVNGRQVGGLTHFMDGTWEAWILGTRKATWHRRRCDAKRAVECAAVRARRAEESEETT